MRALSAPLGVRLQLADGATITGVVSAWSDDAILGSFGYRRWSDLRPADARDLFARLMDRSDPAAWVRLGRMLMGTAGGAGLAESAFRRARAIESSERRQELEDSIEAVRREAAARSARGSESEPPRLRLDDPESRPWPATPWRPLSIAERDAAVEILKEDGAAILTLAGMPPVRPVESEHLLLYWDVPREQSARLAIQLERVVDELARLLTVGTDGPRFWGKALIIVAPDRASFQRLQQRVFLQADRPQRTAMCHCVGEKVVVVAFSGGRGDDLLSRLAGELTFGVLHRHISPIRLPPWANEGLAELVAAEATPEHFPNEVRRQEALQALRGGLPVASLLGAAYGDPAWPGPPGGPQPGSAAVGPAIGRMVLEMMQIRRPSPFAEWVADVKRGADWREAFRKRYGIAPAALARRLIERHRHAD